jgi:nitrate/nitrite transporter NarK
MDSGIGPYLSDLYRSSRSIYLSLFMSIIYSILFIYFLSAFGEIIAWICVILLQLAFIGAAGGSYYMWD